MQAHGSAETVAIKVIESNTSAIAPQLKKRVVIGFSESNQVCLCTVLDSVISIIFSAFLNGLAQCIVGVL